MLQRHGSRTEKIVQVRLTEEAQRLREEAEKIPYGAARDQLLRRANLAEAAVDLDAWLSSPELRPPK